MKASHHIDVQIEEQVGAVDPGPIEQAAQFTLLRHDLGEPCEVVIVISDDESLEVLNRRFRGVARPTDVLAFANETRGPFSGGSDEFPNYLGDVVISLDRAKEQASAVDGSLTEELQVLTVHGVLHLLGYDHADNQEKEQMWSIQSEILRLLGVTIPLPE
jgi:probable rRNA maturation factor